MATKQEYRKKLKQLAIMRAAEEIFLRKPYSAITVNEIAESAGVTKRTLYSYYPSKLALFIQMFENYLQQLHKLILSAAHEDLPPDYKLFRILEIQFSFTRENEAFMRLFWTLDSTEFDGELPRELMETIRLWNRDMIETGIRIVQEGQEQGLIHPCNPESLVHVMSAFVKGIIFHTNKEAKLNIARVEPESLQELFLQIVSKGLCSNPQGIEAALPQLKTGEAVQNA